MIDPAARFSNRVADYLAYRPRYRDALIGVLCARCDLQPTHVIADVGSGTGFLSELFLNHGNTVFAVEPNGPMRAAAEARYGAMPGFHSIDGSAEHSTLPEATIDFVTAGQAFHWFDVEASRREFARILRPGGWVVLVWNERRTEESGFLVDYEALLHQHGTDYAAVDHRNVNEEILAAFYGGGFERAVLDNVQWLDREGLAGRVRSCSYVPAPGDPGYAEMMCNLDAIFDAHQQDGRVAMTYDTRLYFGHLRNP
jgi:SAM-dependent methyltransferase